MKHVELLYLWKYQKNSTPLEINFSSRYRFRVEDVQTHTDQFALKLNLKCVVTEFPIDFWGFDTLHVSLLVGENGSGKTTLMRNILDKVSSLPFYTSTDCLIILRLKDKIYIKCPLNFKIGNEKELSQNNFQLSYAKYDEDGLVEPDMNSGSFSCVWFSNTFNMHNLSRRGDNVHDISLDYDISNKSFLNYKLEELKNIFTFIHAQNNKDFPFFPDRFKFGFSHENISNRKREGFTLLLNNLKNKFKQENHENKNQTFEKGNLKNGIQSFLELFYWRLIVCFLKDATEKKNDRIGNYNFEFILNDTFLKDTRRILEWFNDGCVYEDLKEFNSELLKITNNEAGINKIQTTNVNPFIIEKDQSNRNTINISELAFGGSYIEFDINNSTQEGTKGLSILTNSFLFDYYQLRGLDFLGKVFDYQFPKISTGEYYFLRFFSKIYANRTSINMDEKYTMSDGFRASIYPYYQDSSILIFIDEADIGYHPEWQRRYIKTLIDKIPKILGHENIQFILSTHSPIISSDVPKGNIIYMKDHKAVSMDVESFGANIHSLYKNAFFLQGGLIGEFAKEKIKSLISFFEKEEKAKKWSESEARNLIEIVGEPVLKESLRELYDLKFNGETENERLRRENEELKLRIQLLNKKNENN